MSKTLCLIIASFLSFHPLLSSVTPISPTSPLQQAVLVRTLSPRHAQSYNSRCIPTSNDNVKSYDLIGWHLPKSGLTYRVNFKTKPASLTNTKIKSALAKSSLAWRTADSHKKLLYGGSTSVSSAKQDGVSTVAWKWLPTSSVATTYVWFNKSNNNVREADTIFNKRFSWSQSSMFGDCNYQTKSINLQSAITHEMGHWIGLDDLYSYYEKDLTMFGYVVAGELKKCTLGRGDILGAKAVYP